MKKIIIAMMLLTGSLISHAQIVVQEGSQTSRGWLNLNSPNNYFGLQQYNDTISVDLDEGEKIEIVYRWYDLFRDSEERFDKYFWNNYEVGNLLLQSKLEELPLTEGLKYHIKITTKRNYDHLYSNLGDSATMQRYVSIRDSLVHGLDKDDKKTYRDSLRARKQAYFKKLFPLESILTVTEREARNAQREYKMEGGKLIGQAQWQNILEVSNGYWKVRFYVNDLSDLSAFNEIDLKAFIRGEKQNYIEKGYYRYYTKLNFKHVDGDIKQLRSRRERIRKREQHISLKLTPVVGSSIVKGEWSADMGAMFGMVFNQRRNGAMRIALRYHVKGFGEEGADGLSMKYNGFVDGLIDYNLTDNYKREQWLGAGVGFLVHQEGKVYGDNTARIFLKYRSSQLWGVQPEFNYSFDDNKGFIGLGLFFSL